MKKGAVKIGRKTVRLMSALEGKDLSQLHFHIIAHPDWGDRSDSQAELDRLESRGFARKFSRGGDTLYTLTELGQLLLEDHRKWS